MYNKIFQNLKSWDCPVEKTMDRFLSDKDFYYKCLCEFSNDLNFDCIEKAMLEKNYKKMFECAHSLKGVSANLGLVPIYNSCFNIVELLKNSKTEDFQEKLTEYFNELVAQKKIFLNFLKVTQR